MTGLAIGAAVGGLAALVAARRAAVAIPAGPSPAELAADGARVFSRPSDGGLLEVFERNPAGRRTVVLFHGSMATGKVVELVDEDLLRAADLRVVAPSLPGFGGSRPYDFQDPLRTLAASTRDVLAVLDALGVGRFAVVGVSVGAFFALHLAQEAGEGRVERLATAMGAVWAQPDGHHWLEGAALPAPSRAALRLGEVGPIAFPLARWLLRPLYADPARVPAVMADELGPLGAAHPATARASIDQICRSVRWYPHGMMFAPVWLGRRPRRAHLDWRRLAAIPADLHVGADDRLMSRSNTDYLAERLPLARVVAWPGGHLFVNHHLGSVLVGARENQLRTAIR